MQITLQSVLMVRFQQVKQALTQVITRLTSRTGY